MIKYQTAIGLLLKIVADMVSLKNGDTPPRLKQDVVRDLKTSKIQIFPCILYINGRTAILTNDIYKSLNLEVSNVSCAFFTYDINEK